jgi:hypothetical protein
MSNIILITTGCKEKIALYKQKNNINTHKIVSLKSIETSFKKNENYLYIVIHFEKDDYYQHCKSNLNPAWEFAKKHGIGFLNNPPLAKHLKELSA